MTRRSALHTAPCTAPRKAPRKAPPTAPRTELRYRPALARAVPALLACLCAFAATPTTASEFALAASPPRFELEAKAGERSRQVLEITNAASEASTFAVKTADWTLAPDGSVTFYDELQPGSCRPWVALERRELTVAANQVWRFRYEVNVPADAQAGECRFAIMLEGQEQINKDANGVTFPFVGRLGVVVYLVVGGAQPELSVVGSRVLVRNGKSLPALDVRNSGAAHGRLGGFLTGADASGAKLDYTPANTPILPGETRAVEISATRSGDPDTNVTVSFPATVAGKVEWGKNQSQSIELRLAP